jgi:hypothetical protein
MKIITHVSVFKNMVNQKPQINSGVGYWTGQWVGYEWTRQL